MLNIYDLQSLCIIIFAVLNLRNYDNMKCPKRQKKSYDLNLFSNCQKNYDIMKCPKRQKKVL